MHITAIAARTRRARRRPRRLGRDFGLPCRPLRHRRRRGDRAGALPGPHLSRRRRSRAHACLGRHLARHHRADVDPLLPRPQAPRRGRHGSAEELGDRRCRPASCSPRFVAAHLSGAELRGVFAVDRGHRRPAAVCQPRDLAARRYASRQSGAGAGRRADRLPLDADGDRRRRPQQHLHDALRPADASGGRDLGRRRRADFRCRASSAISGPGWGEPRLPPFSAGFVNLLGMAAGHPGQRLRGAARRAAGACADAPPARDRLRPVPAAGRRCASRSPCSRGSASAGRRKWHSSPGCRGRSCRAGSGRARPRVPPARARRDARSGRWRGCRA